MATNLHLVRKNLIWRLKSIVPTCTISSKTFMPIDRTKISEKDCSGLERGFLLTWDGRGQEHEATDQWQLSAEHEWRLDVMYWAGRGYEDTYEVVLQDQFDIVNTLRDDVLYIGYDDSNQSTDLGIIERRTGSISLDSELDDLWILKMRFLTIVKEIG